jgi:uncharacterized protein (DUF2249 family)
MESELTMNTTIQNLESAPGSWGSPEVLAPTGTETGGARKNGHLDVRELPPARRHSLILETFNRLAAGESFVLMNDHDPKPLYYQFSYEYSGRFAWVYEEQGPEVWQVRIGKIRGSNGVHATVGERA